jgi:hypothetical protein
MLRRRFVWRRFVEETFCAETFCMCALNVGSIWSQCHIWWEVRLTVPTSGQRCHWHHPSLVSVANDTAHQCYSDTDLLKTKFALVLYSNKNRFVSRVNDRSPLVSGVIDTAHNWSAVPLKITISK